jgi:hypothetical protein
VCRRSFRRRVCLPSGRHAGPLVDTTQQASSISSEDRPKTQHSPFRATVRKPPQDGCPPGSVRNGRQSMRQPPASGCADGLPGSVAPVAGVARPCGCQRDDDLHARAESRGRGVRSPLDQGGRRPLTIEQPSAVISGYPDRHIQPSPRSLKTHNPRALSTLRFPCPCPPSALHCDPRPVIRLSRSGYYLLAGLSVYD